MQSIDRRAYEAALGLQQKFGYIEVQNGECLAKCKSEFSEEKLNERKDCMAQCAVKQFKDSESLYKTFYTHYLGKNPEFKKLNFK